MRTQCLPWFDRGWPSAGGADRACAERPAAQNRGSWQPVDRAGRSKGASRLRRSAQPAVLEREGRTATRTRSPSCSLQSSEKMSPMPGIQDPPASCGRRSARTAATSSWDFRRVLTWSRGPIRTTARSTRSSSRRAASSMGSTIWATSGSNQNASASLPARRQRQHRGQRAAGQGQALSAGDRHAHRLLGRRDDEGPADGEIDVGILWGPMAGYYAKQASAPQQLCR